MTEVNTDTDTDTDTKEYNGHPSYEHWNVALHVDNDEGLYQLAMRRSVSMFSRDLMECMPETSDGVEIPPELAAYAWDCLHEDDDDDDGGDDNDNYND